MFGEPCSTVPVFKANLFRPGINKNPPRLRIFLQRKPVWRPIWIRNAKISLLALSRLWSPARRPFFSDYRSRKGLDITLAASSIPPVQQCRWFQEISAVVEADRGFAGKGIVSVMCFSYRIEEIYAGIVAHSSWPGWPWTQGWKEGIRPGHFDGVVQIVPSPAKSGEAWPNFIWDWRIISSSSSGGWSGDGLPVTLVAEPTMRGKTVYSHE